MPRQDESRDVRRTGEESVPHNEPEVLCCVFVFGFSAVWRLLGFFGGFFQAARGESEGEVVSRLLYEGSRAPIRWLFPCHVCATLVLLRSLHLPPSCRSTIWQMLPFTTAPCVPPFFIPMGTDWSCWLTLLLRGRWMLIGCCVLSGETSALWWTLHHT